MNKENIGIIGALGCLFISVSVPLSIFLVYCSVDGAIHSSAGPKLKKECAVLHGGCKTGDAKITAGYDLPAKYVIHTVGPIGEQEKLLRSCYLESLKRMKENKLKSIAFPCISTGIYGYPNFKAAPVAMRTVREWLENDEYGPEVERVIFCLFLKVDVELYEEGMKEFFPVANKEQEDEASDSNSDTPTKKSDSVKDKKSNSESETKEV